MNGQLPPNQRRSMTATVAPRERASKAAASPAGPAPMITKSNGSIGSVWRLGIARALAPRLEQQHRRGDRDVQAVGDAGHRDRDALDRIRPPSGAEALGL